MSAARPGNWFLAQLCEIDRAWLAPYLQTVPVLRGQCLHRLGDDDECVILPHSGIIAIGMPFLNGRLMEAAVVGPEGILGGLAAAASTPALYTSFVRVPGDIARISKAAFRGALEQSPHMRELAARYDAVLMRQMQQSAYCNALHPVEARLCRWLLQMHDRSLSERLPLTQDMIAQSLGVRRTTVTLVAGKLQDSGSINWRRGHVHIANRQLLELHACECYHSIRTCVETLVPEPSEDSHVLPDLPPEDRQVAQLSG
jgi:CRP-like cAMP-binding protein